MLLLLEGSLAEESEEGLEWVLVHMRPPQRVHCLLGAFLAIAFNRIGRSRSEHRACGLWRSGGLTNVHSVT